jgi:hypothetical protein
MNLLLDKYGENPIIDELVFWPPKKQPIKSIRACSTMFRRPFIEVEMQDGEVFHRHFLRDSFAENWAEAIVILETVTTIELISDFTFRKHQEAQKLSWEVEAIRDECIKEVDSMFEEGIFEPYLMQFGEDCKDLPEETARKLAEAKAQTGKTG